MIPLVPRTPRTIDLAVGERCQGPILRRQDNHRLDRHTAHGWVRSIGKRAGLGIVHPDMLRAAFIMAALVPAYRSATSNSPPATPTPHHDHLRPSAAELRPPRRLRRRCLRRQRLTDTTPIGTLRRGGPVSVARYRALVLGHFGSHRARPEPSFGRDRRWSRMVGNGARMRIRSRGRPCTAWRRRVAQKCGSSDTRQQPCRAQEGVVDAPCGRRARCVPLVCHLPRHLGPVLRSLLPGALRGMRVRTGGFRWKL
jgi:hypothetical protein